MTEEGIIPGASEMVSGVDGDSITSVVCSFWDGWSEPAAVKVAVPALGQLLFPDSDVNGAAAERLTGFLGNNGEAISETRHTIMASKFSSRRWSPELNVHKFLYMLSKAVIITPDAPQAPHSCIPFTQAEWSLLSSTLRSFASVFAKATITQRSSALTLQGSMQSPPTPSASCVTRLIPISDVISAPTLY